MNEKSVLVINTPKNCKECDCHLCLVCVPKDEDLEPDENGRYSIPDWCPLRPLPKKFNEGIEYDMDGFGFDKYLETGFKMGWDAYYDKITENHIGENTEKVCNDDLYENWMFFDKGETE